MPVPLLRAANSRHVQPLPDPWPALAASKYEVQFLPGAFMMLAGPPGAGKTFLALDAALKMNCPTLYLSCDSDESTMVVRAAAAVTKHQQRQVRESLKRGMFKEVYGDHLRGTNIRLDFEPSNPTMQDLGHIFECYFEIEGRYPALTILDNVMNLEADSDNEWAAMRRSAKELHWLARKTKTCFLALHHTQEPDKDWLYKAQPRSAIQGKISQLCSVIMTMATNGYEMFVAVVKQRAGQSDPGALHPIRFTCDLSRAQIWDEPEMVRRQRENQGGKDI